MNIRIIAVGKIKSKYINEGVCDFGRRLSKYSNFEAVEVKDEKHFDKNGVSGAVKKEGERIAVLIEDKDFVVCLDVRGAGLSTERFADFIKEKKMERVKRVVFIIGGPCGICPTVLERADYLLSLSDMTFPHEIARLVLLEQLYRAEKILAGEPYHK